MTNTIIFSKTNIESSEVPDVIVCAFVLGCSRYISFTLDATSGMVILKRLIHISFTATPIVVTLYGIGPPTGRLDPGLPAIFTILYWINREP